MNTQAVIFDFDDTLVASHPLFIEAQQQVFDRFLQLGIGYAEEWADYLNQRDIDHVIRLGRMSNCCFPQAIGETYAHFAARSNLALDASLAAELERIGWQVFELDPPLNQGAEQVLAALQGRVGLYLLTQGEHESQSRRVAASGLGRYFTAIEIAPVKDENTLRALLKREGLDAERCWMVGNSIRSDINPALAAGMSAIHYQVDAWDYDLIELAGRPHTITRLEQILELI